MSFPSTSWCPDLTRPSRPSKAISGTKLPFLGAPQDFLFLPDDTYQSLPGRVTLPVGGVSPPVDWELVNGEQGSPFLDYLCLPPDLSKSPVDSCHSGQTERMNERRDGTSRSRAELSCKWKFERTPSLDDQQ